MHLFAVSSELMPVSTAAILGGAKTVVTNAEVVSLAVCSLVISCQVMALTPNSGGKNDSLT